MRGRIRVWRLGGLGPSFGLLSRNSQNIFIFANLFWQLILENGDDCLDKIFFVNFSKNKIGFNKNNFLLPKICNAMVVMS